MNRLVKKCMMASMGLHTLLILVLFVGPAFFSKPSEPMDPIITLENFTITDGKTRGGGNPTVTEAPAPAPPQQEPPQAAPAPPVQEPEQPTPAPPEPVQAKPEPREETRAPESKPPEKGEEVKVKDPEAIPVVTKKPVTKPAKVEPKFNLKPINKTTAKTTKPTDKTSDKEPPKFTLNKVTGRTVTPQNNSEATAKAAADARRTNLSNQLARNIGQLSSSIGRSAATGTSVEMPGPGGEAFVNYGQLVRDIYESAWRDPSEIADSSVNVKVQVVVDRSGSVDSARIVNRSGISAMDKSVQSALDRVRSIGAPFPASSKERQRTFIINFNLKTRRLTG